MPENRDVNTAVLFSTKIYLSKVTSELKKASGQTGLHTLRILTSFTFKSRPVWDTKEPLKLLTINTNKIKVMWLPQPKSI